MMRIFTPTLMAASLILGGSPSFAQRPSSSEHGSGPIDCGSLPGKAEFQKAWSYDQGIDVQINIPEAIRLYRYAAASGNPLAKGRLARICFNGNGVPENKREAERLSKGILSEVTKAAEQDIPVAQLVLASMYADGLGVPRDQDEELKWLRKAADHNMSLAQSNLGVVYENGVGVEKDELEAAKWYRKAANQGNAIAEAYLGDMYYCGRGVPKDQLEAFRLYRKSAEHNFAAAENNLAHMYDDGCVVRRDRAQALAWFRKAADQDFALAQRNLGTMYSRRCDLWYDLGRAVYWYRKAAALGDEDSVRELRCLGHEP